VDEVKGNRFLNDWRDLNYSYLVLVVAGMVLAVWGFVKNGNSENGRLGATVLFLVGIVLLALGTLLTNVPGFFSG
jgi:uncharacterized membrane protein